MAMEFSQRRRVNTSIVELYFVLSLFCRLALAHECPSGFDPGSSILVGMSIPRIGHVEYKYGWFSSIPVQRPVQLGEEAPVPFDFEQRRVIPCVPNLSSFPAMLIL